MLIVCSLDMMWLKIALYLSDITHNTQSQSTHEKNIRQTPVESNSTKHFSIMPENYQGHQKQGMSVQLALSEWT